MYDRQFYDTINEGSRKSAAVVAPLVHSFFNPKSVIDVGCGEGVWTKAFKDLDCDVIGVDGPYIDRNHLWIAPGEFRQCDLQRERLPKDLPVVDMAISLEVAEHLTQDRAHGFVADLVSLSDVVLFSAAIPGQGGTNHVNEQWPAYWVDLFRNQGYYVTGALRWLIWQDAVEGKVENWYAQNLLLAVSGERFQRLDHDVAELFKGVIAQPFPVVHPVLWDSRR